ncbi:hypothetical protein VR46_37660 [Streptomyces sp. NRRL S-444]|nr:hypothetical protein VR46_37660 [Streptomyces sp. NRRL S-444]
MAGLGDDADEGVSAQDGQPTALCSVIVRQGCLSGVAAGAEGGGFALDEVASLTGRRVSLSVPQMGSASLPPSVAFFAASRTLSPAPAARAPRVMISRALGTISTPPERERDPSGACPETGRACGRRTVPPRVPSRALISPDSVPAARERALRAHPRTVTARQPRPSGHDALLVRAGGL